MGKINILTGAAGFIGSVLGKELIAQGLDKMLAVDDFSKTEKATNWETAKYLDLHDRDHFLQWFERNAADVGFVFHIGARTDTAEFDKSIFDTLNVNYSKDLWKMCSRHSIPFIYASSAATYGGGENGYSDNHELIPALKPLNPYGESKQEFDTWVLKQKERPPFWAGLKFFNVFGPNEYHKGRMASVVFHAFNQIKEKDSMKLFRSHREDFADGMQMRDFIYVKDIASIVSFLAEHRPESGIYNAGTGKARAFLHLAQAVFAAMGKENNISFIDTPEDIRDKYQYFTEADMSKLRSAGYNNSFYSLEEGVRDYVQNYLIPQKTH